MEHYAFFKQYTDNDDDINFLCKFIEDTKKGKHYNYLVVIYGYGNNGKTTAINYIKKQVHDDKCIQIDRFYNILDLNLKNIYLIFNLGLEYCEKKDISVVKFVLENTNYNLLVESQIPDLYLKKSIFPLTKLIHFNKPYKLKYT